MGFGELIEISSTCSSGVFSNSDSIDIEEKIATEFEKREGPWSAIENVAGSYSWKL